VRAALPPVVLAALLALTGCGGGGGGSEPAKASVVGPIGQGGEGVYLFRPAGKPKRMVIFFHGQGGPEETTPTNHRPWIDHLVREGAIVLYPRYETAYSGAVLENATTGVRTAMQRLGPQTLPVLALGYSRGAALAVEYAAAAPGQHLPVPNAIESVNPVPYGEQARVVDLRPIRPSTILSILVSEEDPYATDGMTLLLDRLRRADFPPDKVQLHVARSKGAFTADHLAPLSSSAASRAAYWRPTDALLSHLAGSR
jgi:pimeloyl-ACP methyl ester carboxylesterase